MKVLIVDDSEEKAKRLADAVREHSADNSIAYAATAHDGFRLAASEDFNLILLDVVLPLTIDASPSEEGSLWFAREVLRKLHGSTVPLIVGATQFQDSLAKVEGEFRKYLWSIILVTQNDDRWLQQIKHALRYAAFNAPRWSLSGNVGIDAVDVAIVAALRLPEFEELVGNIGGGDAIELEQTGEKWLTNRLATKGGREISVLAACADEMGMTAMSGLVTRVCVVSRPKVLILVGIMGGNPGRVEMSDLVIVEETWDCRGGKISERGFEADVKGRNCSYRLANRIAAAATGDFLYQLWNRWTGDKPRLVPKLHKGAVACSPSVLADGASMKELEDQKRKVFGVEMEAYGCYDAVHHLAKFGPEVICIKSVCDLGDPAKSDRYQRYCAFLSSAVAVATIKDDSFLT